MGIELRQLRYFVAVAEELHFRRAAQRLYVTQPALSQQILRLEKEVGVPLFERNRRRVDLTRAGAALLDGARQTLLAVDQCVAGARWAGGLRSSALRVGYPIYGMTRVRTMLRSFRERHPDVWLDEHELYTVAQLGELNAGTLDVGFVSPTVRDDAVTVQPILAEELVVALPSPHFLARMTRIPLHSLVNERLIMPAPGSAPGYRGRIAAYWRLARAEPHEVWLDESQPFELGTTLPMVAAGEGLLLLLTAAPAVTVPGIVFRPVSPPKPLAKLALAWRRDDPSPLVRTFVHAIQEARHGAASGGPASP